MLKLVIPVDGSEASLRAIDTVARLFLAGGVAATLLHVREGKATYHGDISPRDYERIADHERDKQTRILEEALQHAKAQGITQVQCEAEAGTPEVDIPSAAERLGADMIVMATRGLGAVSALLMGSVAQKVVHAANVPVLLVK